MAMALQAPARATNKGRILAVDPLRDDDQKQRMEGVAQRVPLHWALFRLGLTGLRMADVVRLRVGQVRGKPVGYKVNLIEGKTGKQNYFMITPNLHKALVAYLGTIPHAMDEQYLFVSPRGTGTHLQSASVGHMVRRWAREAGLQEHYGTHTLRKTWGYLKRVGGTDLEIIRARYNHHDLNMTKLYIQAHTTEVVNVLMEEI